MLERTKEGIASRNYAPNMLTTDQSDLKSAERNLTKINERELKNLNDLEARFREEEIRLQKLYENSLANLAKHEPGVDAGVAEDTKKLQEAHAKQKAAAWKLIKEYE